MFMYIGACRNLTKLYFLTLHLHGINAPGDTDLQSFLHSILYHSRQGLPEPNFLMLYTESAVIGGIRLPEKGLGSTASFSFLLANNLVISLICTLTHQGASSVL